MTDHAPGPDHSHVRQRIRQLRQSLSEAEQRACDVLLRLERQAAYTHITEIARQAKVSDATVTRMCRHLQFASFRDLKLALAAEPTARDDHGPGTETLSPEILLLRQTVRVYQDALEDTALMLPAATLAAFCTMIAGASRIIAVGIGGSAMVAADFCHKLGKLGMPAVQMGDSDMITIASASARPGHVLIGISHTGRTSAIITALQRARTLGASTIALTNNTSSPIVDVADLTVAVAAQPSGLQTSELAGRISQLLILDAVYTILALQDIAGGGTRLDAVTRAFDSQRIR